MKILVTLATVLCMGAFYGCDDPAEPPTAECEHCKDYSKEQLDGVPAGLAYNMIKNYKVNHWNNYLVEGKTQPTDARSIWFSLDALKKFIYKIEEATCKKGSANMADLGIRFYYAEYPEIDIWNRYDNNPSTLQHRTEYQGLHTLIMAPTYYNANSKMNVDFDPRYVKRDANNQLIPMTMDDVFRQLGADIQKDGTITGGVENALMLAPDVKTTIKNKGSLIPPPPLAGGSNVGERNGAVMLDLVENIVHDYNN